MNMKVSNINNMPIWNDSTFVTMSAPHSHFTRLGHIRTNGPIMQKVSTGVARMWTTINTYILIPVQDLHLTYTA